MQGNVILKIYLYTRPWWI